MRELILMRHAKSDWSDEGASDHDRVLNPRGRADAPRIGLWLDENGLVPDLVLCSTASRASETLDLVAKGWSAEDVPVYHSRKLYHSSPETVIKVVNSDAGDAERVLVVAHNPGLEILAGHYSGACGHFPTAAVIALRFDLSDWSRLTLGSSAEVIDSTRPKAL